MKAVTLWQPYLAGVLHGDAWCTALTIGLRAKDRDFVEAFAEGFNFVTGIAITPKTDERGYWLVRSGNKSGRFDALRAYDPVGNDEVASWLRGLFDSEGNAQILALPHVGPNSFHRRIAIYSTNRVTIAKAAEYLERLNISNTSADTKSSASHKGSKIVVELRITRRDGFVRFAELVGSSIARKTEKMTRIVGTYQSDVSASARASQLLGAKAKRKNTIAVTLPRVIEGVAELIRAGVSPTQRACRVIRGFDTIQRFVSQYDLVEAARKII